VILADEMGLGKTIQILSFLRYLFSVVNISSPILILAPNSTLFNWLKEINVWLNDLNCVVYFGSMASRAVIRQHEFLDKNN
jgi:SNF2 family DNA or RNA helicase